MASYTQESLNKLSKTNVINIALSLQSKLESVRESVKSLNEVVSEEARRLNENFLKLEFGVECLKTG